MQRTLSDELAVRLAQLLIEMRLPREMRLDILTAIETQEQLTLFYDKLFTGFFFRNCSHRPQYCASGNGD